MPIRSHVHGSVLYTKSMNLHRIESSTEWHAIKVSKQNNWQRVAARTHGIITIGNVLTLLGFLLVLIGLSQILTENSMLGIVLIFIGRVLDLADGWAAHITGTKSFIGEVADATADKAGTFLTVVVIGITDIAPWAIILGLIAPQVLISIIIYIQRCSGKDTHASLLGKLSMAGTWIALAGLLMNHLLHNDALLVVSYAVAYVSISCGIIAAINYMRQPSK